MKENFGLYLILTDPRTDYATCARAAVDCGVRYLQLRMKNTPPEIVLETALAVRAITRHTPTRFIVNDSIDIAMAADADGIHLGQDDLSLAEARRRWVKTGKIYGLSTHTMEQVRAAETDSPDYIGVGPVYRTPTKPDAAPPLGPNEVGLIAQSSPLTSVAIGGITMETLPELLEAGVRNYCVVSAVNSAADPADAIRKLQGLWKSHCF